MGTLARLVIYAASEDEARAGARAAFDASPRSMRR